VVQVRRLPHHDGLPLGLSLPNTPATIDSDHRGELLVAMINLGTEPVTTDHP
jgi:dUTPase